MAQPRRRIFHCRGWRACSGSQFWTANDASGNSRGTWKLFSDAFTAEQLKVSYSVGDRNDRTLPVVTAFLFADTNGDNTYAWTERIVDTATQSRSQPVSGWSSWVDTYAITENTKTALGEAVVGKKIGFFILANVGTGEALSFDALQIETIPEPATLGFATAAGLALLFVRRLFMI